MSACGVGKSHAIDQHHKCSPKGSVCIRIYQGAALVDIREMYEKDGEELPGRKGISLTPEQWTDLKGGLDVLDSAMQATIEDE